jgi:hypothetical protein
MIRQFMILLGAFAVVAAGSWTLFTRSAMHFGAHRRTVNIYSESGHPLDNLFTGRSPNPHLLATAHKYRDAQPQTCTAPKRLLNRAANMASKLGDLLGLTPNVVHAQSCSGCGVTITEYDCPGGAPCDDYVADLPGYGGPLWQGGEVTNSDACGDPDNGCPMLYDGISCYNMSCDQ